MYTYSIHIYMYIWIYGAQRHTHTHIDTHTSHRDYLILEFTVSPLKNAPKRKKMASDSDSDDEFEFGTTVVDARATSLQVNVLG